MADQLENKAGGETPPDKGKEANPAENQNEDKTLDQVPDDLQEQLREEIRAELKAEAHKETSKFGRRLTAMEETMNTFLENASAIFVNKNNSSNEEKRIDGDDYLTLNDLQRLQAEQSKKQQESNAVYGKSYIKHIKTLGDRDGIDEEIHLQAMKLTTDDDGKFNVRSSDDPRAAAEINYLKALMYLQKGKKTVERTPDNNLPPGVSATKTEHKKAEDVELDAEAQEYATRRGISLEKAKKLLNDKTPIYAAGGHIL